MHFLMPRREGEGGGPLTLRKGRLGGRCRCSGPQGRGGAGEVDGGDVAPRRPTEGPREGVGWNRGRGAAEALRGILRSGGGAGAETGRCHGRARRRAQVPRRGGAVAEFGAAAGFLDSVDAAAGHGGAGRRQGVAACGAACV